jgi:hypothetical protein
MDEERKVSQPTPTIQLNETVQHKKLLQAGVQEETADRLIFGVTSPSSQNDAHTLPDLDKIVDAPLKERLVTAPPRCINPHCDHGHVWGEGKDDKGNPAVVPYVCTVCHGTGFQPDPDNPKEAREWPTAEQTRHEPPCIYCWYDIDGTGGDFEERKARCRICRGTGVTSKRFYQRLLFAVQTAPTHENELKSVATSGTLTLPESLRRSFAAITTLIDRPYRLLVIRDAEAHDHYFIRAQHISERLDDPGLAIERPVYFPVVEEYLRNEIGAVHINPQGWAPFTLPVRFTDSGRLRDHQEGGK